MNHMIPDKETTAENMESFHQILREEMKTAQLRQKGNYDQHGKPDPNLKSGDMVWFIPRNFKTMRPSKKLDYKKMGPFKIIKKVGTSSYKLDLPASMRIHNTFHISLLEPYEDNKFPSQIQIPPPSIEIDGEPNLKKSLILASTATNSNTEPSGLVTLLNTIRPGIQQKTSTMPASPQNNSTPGIPGKQDWVHVTISRSASEPHPAKGEKTPTPPPATAQEGWNNSRFLPHSTTPTSPPYCGPVETTEQRRAKMAAIHPALNWASCYDDECPVHLSENQGENWFPRKPSKK